MVMVAAAAKSSKKRADINKYIRFENASESTFLRGEAIIEEVGGLIGDCAGAGMGMSSGTGTVIPSKFMSVFGIGDKKGARAGTGAWGTP